MEHINPICYTYIMDYTIKNNVANLYDFCRTQKLAMKWCLYTY
jgi:hypothetical protein